MKRWFINKNSRPWFGPKRFGIGISPQTWQGWLVIIAPIVLIIVIEYLLNH
jgi:hypothetical protein